MALLLEGKKVPWWEKIGQKDWPTKALLKVVYELKAKSRKRKGTDLDAGIVDASDLPAPKKAIAPKKVTAPKKATASKTKASS